MKFKVGERVVMYNGQIRYELKISKIGYLGTLFFFPEHNPGHNSYVAHPKQCRRLVKKPVRRIWLNRILVDKINPLYEFETIPIYVGPKPSNPDFIEFVEVRKKK
jgi:hypothetical protein